MAPVGGRPFLTFVLKQLMECGIQKAILSVGYKHESILTHFGHRYESLILEYSIESEPLGTGGAIALALDRVSEEQVWVVNGDTFFDVDFGHLYAGHVKAGADLSMALKPMKQFDRYGSVTVDRSGRILGFTEKQYREAGLINGGIYVMRTSAITAADFPEKFSFEKDFLEKNVSSLYLQGMCFDGYFTDIGIPEDYRKASVELEKRFGASNH
jgi:D-glycero-alpha-D-manno-heptose 1-phosphate guanylyltransferase